MRAVEMKDQSLEMSARISFQSKMGEIDTQLLQLQLSLESLPS
jgi:hypothetical protein